MADGPWNDYASSQPAPEPSAGPWQDYATPQDVQPSEPAPATGTVPVLSEAETAQAAMRDAWEHGQYFRAVGNLIYGMGATAVEGAIQGHQRTTELMNKEGAGTLTDEERLELGINFGMGLGGGDAISDFRRTVTDPAISKIARDAMPTGPDQPAPSALNDLIKAHDLGVIGNDAPQPNINTLPPKVAAARAMPAMRRPDDTISGEVEQPNIWRQRFEQTLDKMETSDDARALIRNSLDRNNDFEAARQGYISLGQTEALGDVTGLDPQHIDIAGTSRKIKTNEEMRNVIQAFRAINDKIQGAAQDLTAKGGTDDEAEVEAFTKLRLQRDALLDAAVEPYVALRAEFGRAGNVLQEFMKIKRAAGDQMRIVRDNTGRGVDDMRNEARMIAGTPAEDVPQTLEGMRRDTIGPVYWTWIQGLISGWLTHTKYFAANELYSDIERGVVTPIAATIGKAKQLAGVDTDRVLFGETAAGLWGQIGSIPKAAYTTVKAIKAGVRMPLEDEIALYKSAIERGEKVPTPIQKVVEASQIPAQRGVTGQALRKATAPVLGEKAADVLGYGWSRFLGSPGDMASGIHTFYRVRGRQAEMESLAYRKAASEGLNPVNPEFWHRQQWWVANPTDEMRVKSVAASYNSTFMGELSPEMKQLAGAIRKNKYLKWIFPFMHIPVKLLEAFQSYTPLTALNPEMRDAVAGKMGGAEQDKALARLVVGTGVMGYVYHKFMMGRATGDFPQDQKERKLWMDTGKQANSILIGDHWVSFDRFGTVGDLARMAANLGHAAMLWQQDGKVGDSLDQQLGDFAGALALSAVRLVTDEVGFQTIQRAVEAWDDREKWSEFIGMEASSFIPFSSAVSQLASGGVPFSGAGGDPYMRKIHGMWDAIKYRLPGARETLQVKRDWMGRPVANPQYGNILRQTKATQDPVDLELARLGITPGPARGYIGHAKLTADQYDEYAGTAAPLIHQRLQEYMQQPGYAAIPQPNKIVDIRNDISRARAEARKAMQAHHPELIQQGTATREKAITGQ